MKRQGFTLIELLVVIAIIAILAAILFPVFARAKAKARATTCLSNIKQLAVSVKMYQSDWDDCFPRSEINLYNGSLTRQLGWWVDYLGTDYSANGTVVPYIRNTEILVCPDWQGNDPAYADICSYGYNAHLGWHTDDDDGVSLGTWGRSGELVCEATLAQSAGTIMIADHCYPSSPCHYIYPVTSYSIYNRAAARHFNNFNAGFADGHAKALDWETNWLNSSALWDYM